MILAARRARGAAGWLIPLALTLALVAGAVVGWPGVLAATPVAPAGAAQDLQAMIDATEPGGRLEVPAGTYAGPIRVEQPIELIGVGDPVIDGGGAGNVVEITAPGTRLVGFSIRGSGSSLTTGDAGVRVREAPGVEVVGNRLDDVLFGVYLENSPDSLVEGNHVGAKDIAPTLRGDSLRLYGSGNTLVRQNRFIDGRDLIISFADDVVLEENEIRGGRYGAHFMYSHHARVERNRFQGNAIGVWLMFSHQAQVIDNVMSESFGASSSGIGLKDCDTTLIRGNRIVGNEVGVYNDSSPFSPGAEIRYEHNLFAGNDMAVRFTPSVHDNVFTENAFVGNRQQVAVAGSGDLEGNRWSVDGRGNHWADYAGYDADGDGVGDVPYRAVDLFGELSDRHPDLELFADTPAARAVDLASSTFPVLQPDPRAVDDAPLVHMPDIPAAVGGGPGGRSWSLAVASLALVAVAVATVLGPGGLGRRRGAAR